jgi:hypothetical protein
MDIHQLGKSGSSIYYQEDFMAFLEQHLSYIERHGVTLATITPTGSYKHEGNFYGVLNELKISVNFHYITMRINGLKNSNEFNGIDVDIKIPDFGVIDQLKNQYLTLKK